MGITLAIPIAASSNTSILNVVDKPMWFNSIWLLMGLAYTLYYVVKTSSEATAEQQGLLAGSGSSSGSEERDSMDMGRISVGVGRSSMMSGGSGGHRDSNYDRSSECELPSKK